MPETPFTVARTRLDEGDSSPLPSSRTSVHPLPLLGALRDDGERFEILCELATGGMATVYLARLRRAMGFSRLVAIKCMHPHYAKDPNFAAMFVDEATLTARLRHPNIVATVDIVAGDGQLLLVMEYIEGESLAALTRLMHTAGDKLPVAIACAIVHDVLLGLHEAHEAEGDDRAPLGIVHRDVSPQNVMVGLDGLARVLDFGVAKARCMVHHSEVGEIKGKIPYMAPEQLFGEELDRKVDVYAAGVMLWEILVGSRLFEGGSETALVQRIMQEPIPTPSSRRKEVPAELDALVLRAMSRDPNDRFPTALAMAEQLSAIVSLPPRTEISAWTKKFVRPRDLPPSTPSLPRVDSEAKPASRRTSPITSPIASRRVPFVLLGVFILLLASAALAIPRRNTPAVAANLQADATRVANVTTPAAAAPPALAPPAVDPVVTTPDSAKTNAPIVTANAPRARAARPIRATPPSAPAAGILAAMPKDQPNVATPPAANPPAPVIAPANANTASCRLPYTVDADGHRHYKSECL